MLTPEQLAEIEARAGRHRLETPWPDDTHPDLLDLERLIGTDVPALLAEIERLRDALKDAADQVAEADHAVALEQENARVRETHAPTIKEADDGEKLVVCRSCDGLRESCSDEAEPEPWPCATIRAMDGGEGR